MVDRRVQSRNDLPPFVRRCRGAEAAALVVSLAKDNKHSDVYGSLFLSGALSLLCAFFFFLMRPQQSQQKALRLMTVKVISEPRRRLTFLHFPTIMKRDKRAN